MSTAAAFISGALVMAYVVAGLFFLRFRRDSGDRLFAFFAAAFWLLAIQRVIVTLSHPSETIYLMRAAAFVLIIIAIIDKNRGQSSRR